MFITTSRKTNNLDKKIANHLSLFLPTLKFIPRGKTPLNKLFEKSNYLGYNFFLKLRSEKGIFVLEIYKKEKDQYFLDTSLFFEINELDLKVSKKQIKEQNHTLFDETNLLFFLELDDNKDSDYCLKKEDNIYSFNFKNQNLGFSFKLLKIEK